MRKVMMESCRAVIWCWVSSLMKMVTFLAGPLVSMCSPVRAPVCAMLAAGGKQRAQPHTEIADGHAAQQIKQAHPALAIAHGLIRLVLEARERGVSSQDSHNQKQTPVGMGMEPLRQQRHEDADEERAGDIDDESTQ